MLFWVFFVFLSLWDWLQRREAWERNQVSLLFNLQYMGYSDPYGLNSFDSVKQKLTTALSVLPSEIAQVIAPYTATGAEQLTLAPGQLILIRKKNPGGWWEGELQVFKFPDISERYHCLFSCFSSLLTEALDISLCVYAVRVCLRSTLWQQPYLRCCPKLKQLICLR